MTETTTKAVVLAAGVGSRLRPLTRDRPKPCVTVGSRPILAHQLHAYADAGVVEVVVVAGYLADDVRALCTTVAVERPDLEITVIENEIYDETNNMYSLSLAREIVGGEAFCLSNGDVVFDPRVAAELAGETESAIACDSSIYDDESMKITLDSHDRVEHIAKDIHEREADATSIDAYRFSAEFSTRLFEEIDRRLAAETGDWTEVAIDALLGPGDHDVGALDIAGARWVEIDGYDDLHRADRVFSTLTPLREKKAVFFDLDGTLYLGDDVIPGAPEIVATLREADVSVYFLSNNSSNWKDVYAAKLRSFGISATEEDIILSTDGVIDYLTNHDKSASVLGTRAMCDAMADAGVTITEKNPDAVVVGFDTELTYEKAKQATLSIRGGAEFLLAHPDMVCPTPEGPIPDCGSIGAFVGATTDEEPARVFGKPDPGMLAHVLEGRGFEPSEVAVVGDRLETEIRLADHIDCESVCVLTGDATRAAVEASPLSPSLVARSVAALDDFC